MATSEIRADPMFLLRVAFWLSIAVFFIPADPDSGREAPRVSALEALVAARAVVSDLSGFCERNPDVCVTGNAAFDIFAEKAQHGVKLLNRYLMDNDGAESGKSGTLTDRDRAPAWRAPSGAHPA
jgi:hypothetical protein